MHARRVLIIVIRDHDNGPDGAARPKEISEGAKAVSVFGSHLDTQLLRVRC